ncbi:MAG: family 20 glycosylhydrolase [Planctomycetota bacterium]
MKSYIDNLAMHKINVFHWHLTDDDGWRIEIKGYPKLTELGAWRGANEVLPPSYGSGAERYVRCGKVWRVLHAAADQRCRRIRKAKTHGDTS